MNIGDMQTLAEMVKPLAAAKEAVQKLAETIEKVGKVFDAQRSFDKLNASLVVATGSAGNAAQAFNALQAFAAATPFNVEESTKAFIKLRTMALDPSQKALHAYGNTAAAFGKNLGEVVDALSAAANGDFKGLENFGIKAEKNGNKVALTYQNITKTIGNSATEIQAYMQQLGETRFAGAMDVQVASLDGAIGNLGDAWDAFTLKLSQSGAGDAARAGIEGLIEILNTLGEHVDAISSGMKTAAEIGASYFGVFFAAPAILETAKMAIVGVRTELAAGATVSDLLSKNFGGVSASAEWASDALGKLKVAGGVLFAAFAGWEIGTWLRENFVEARIAGLTFVGLMLTGWEKLKYGAELVGEAISAAFDKSIGSIKENFASYLSVAAKGLSLIGATDAAKDLDRYAARLQTAAGAQESFAERTAAVAARHKAALAEIDKNITEMVGYELAHDQKAVKKAAEVVDLGKFKTHAKAKANGTGKASGATRDEDENALRRRAELLGVNADYIEQLTHLQKIREAGNIEEAQYIQLVEQLIAKQPGATKMLEEQNKTKADALAAAAGGIEAINAETRALDEKREAYDKLPDAIMRARIAELEALKQSVILTDKGRADIQGKIDALRAPAGAQEQVPTKQATEEAEKRAGEAAKKAEDEWKRTADSIQKSLTDALVRGFGSGKSMAKELGGALKNIFDEHLLRPALKLLTGPLMQSMGSLFANIGGNAGAGSAAGGAVNNALGSFMNFGLGLSGILSSFGSYAATGFMNTIAGTGMSAGLNAAGAMIAEGAWTQGIGMAAGALGPIALGAAAIYTLAKSLDHSGTPHTGGAASSSGGTTSIIRAESLHFEKTATAAGTEKFVSGVASSAAAILDSTATAFGRKAGYAVATAFADDSSKDGAWGGLTISNGGNKILDWQDTRTSRWAPKEFADGEAGQKQYLAEVSKSVRYALDQIGLPAWAGKMLDALGDAPALDELAKTVETINKTEGALKVLGERLAGFGAMSDDAVASLMSAAGGIDALAGSASAYYDAFYSDSEKTAVLGQQVAEALQKVGLAMPASRDEFRTMVEAQMKLGTAGAPAVAALLGVAGAFAQLHPAVASAASSVESARSALTEAYQAEADALKAANDRMSSFAASLRKLHDNALLGNQSPLTPQQKYLEAKAQYERTLSAARAGDQTAQEQYADAYNAFLSASQAVNASGAQYQRDFAYAQAATEEAIRWAEKQVDVGQASLDALNRQVAGLIDVKNEVKSVSQAINDLATAMGASGVAAASREGAVTALYQSMLDRVPDPEGFEYWTQRLAEGHSIAEIAGGMGQSAEYQQLHGGAAYLAPAASAVDYSAMGTSNMTALVDEIKALRADNQALREEVRGLRTDAERQTGDLMAANAAATDNSANKIADATTRAASFVAQLRETRVMPE
jgi:Domain of unknown function (DUF4214)